MVVHPHAAALDGLTAASAQAKAAFEEAEEGASSAGAAAAGVAAPLDDDALDALAAAVTANAARNRWLEQATLCTLHMLSKCSAP